MVYTSFGKSKIGSGTVVGDHVLIGYPSRDELSGSGSLDPAKLEHIDGTIIGENCTLRDFGIIYSKTVIGNNVQTGHHYLVREETKIGNKSLIGSNVIIENKCKIGNNVSIQSGVYIPTFCEIGDDVFLGPNAVLTNDKYIGYGDSRKRGMEGVVIEDKVMEDTKKAATICEQCKPRYGKIDLGIKSVQPEPSFIKEWKQNKYGVV